MSSKIEYMTRAAKNLKNITRYCGMSTYDEYIDTIDRIVELQQKDRLYPSDKELYEYLIGHLMYLFEYLSESEISAAQEYSSNLWERMQVA